jgi:alcohol dehydrogenase class IV
LIFNETLTAEQTIDRIERFFSEIGSPIRVSQLGIKGEDQKKRFYEQVLNDQPQGFHIIMTNEDYKAIIDLMWE